MCCVINVSIIGVFCRIVSIISVIGRSTSIRIHSGRRIYIISQVCNKLQTYGRILGVFGLLSNFPLISSHQQKLQKFQKKQ